MRILVFILAFAALPVLAVEPLPSSVLSEQCADTGGDGIKTCRAWVQGFIGGGFATGNARFADPEKSESFTERATRTRVSRGRTVYGPNPDAGYCLLSTTTLDEIIGKLPAHAAGMKSPPEHANQLMLGLLRKHYPCP